MVDTAGVDDCVLQLRLVSEMNVCMYSIVIVRFQFPALRVGVGNNPMKAGLNVNSVKLQWRSFVG